MRIRLKLARNSKDASTHFSKVAEAYPGLRTTDEKPIIDIKNRLEHLSGKPIFKAVDIGCGDGRYSRLLAKHLSNQLCLICVDKNRQMLDVLVKYLDDSCLFGVVQSGAEHTPFCAKSFDFITTFNAAHHFKLKDFLAEMARILVDGGLLFIYTRTQEQNRQNIWGGYFPDFAKKETRLWREGGFYRLVAQTGQLTLQDSVYFTYRRQASLKRLVKQAEGHHYSTFCFYSEKNFAKALNRFRENIMAHFTNPARIRWTDENVLFVLEKIKEEPETQC
jgi:ubiquinone/menaquinone biosynthesis C-methylase UbiE